MMGLIEFWLFWCSIGMLSFVLPTEQDTNCTNMKGNLGRCVYIDNCPEFKRIAYSRLVTKPESDSLAAHRCGLNKVCCEKPSFENTSRDVSTTTVVSTTTFISTTTEIIVELPPILPNETVCGLDAAAERVYGGDTTEKEQFRWTVALDFNQRERKGVLCGGSLINTKYVITAAHCVYNVSVKELKLRLGEWDLEENPDCDEYGNCNPDVDIRAVSKIIIHPKYGKHRHDIALLRLTEALPDDYTSHILPICLPLSEELRHNIFTDEDVSVVGWGETETEIRSQKKMFAKLQIISLEECAEQLSDLKVRIDEMHICARSATNKIRDTCTGDSGGPLQIQLNGNYYLIGVTSFGYYCGATLLPGTYTRITFYLDWILKNIVH